MLDIEKDSTSHRHLGLFEKEIFLTDQSANLLDQNVELPKSGIICIGSFVGLSSPMYEAASSKFCIVDFGGYMETEHLFEPELDSSQEEAGSSLNPKVLVEGFTPKQQEYSESQSS